MKAAGYVALSTLGPSGRAANFSYQEKIAQSSADRDVGTYETMFSDSYTNTDRELEK